MASSKDFSIASARDKFPHVDRARKGLPGQIDNTGEIMLDNASETQMLGSVIEAISTYYTNPTNTPHKDSNYLKNALSASQRFINASSADEIAIGNSTAQLLHNLSTSFLFPQKSEIIVAQINHECNISPWLRMAERQDLIVKWWTVKGPAMRLEIDDLLELISEKTCLVALTHACGILGNIEDVEVAAEVVHRMVPEAVVCVDGVEFAPHRRVDVSTLGVDIYVWSWNNVFGPHLSCIWIEKSLKDDHDLLEPFSYFFDHPLTSLQVKFGLYAANPALTSSIPQIVDYLNPDPVSSWAAIMEHEAVLQKILIDYLNSRSDVRIHGEKSPDPVLRVAIVSFNINGWMSQDVVEFITAKDPGLGVAWGHFDSFRLVAKLLHPKEDGVIRVSMVHYNTVEEVKRLVDVLKEIEIGGDQGLLAHMERLSLVSLDSGTNTPARSE
ncbi:pyridoxal phosphate-dependent transferase [Morchella snyderi]|nr:pyridoxal phosphate-dependent transferase [Morchella snyderi]